MRKVQGSAPGKVIRRQRGRQWLQEWIGSAVKADRLLTRLTMLLRGGEPHEERGGLRDPAGHIQASLLCHTPGQTRADETRPRRGHVEEVRYVGVWSPLSS